MTIYGLIDPRRPELFYVGCASDVYTRLRKHRTNVSVQSKAGRKLCTRIRAIIATGALPDMVLLERTEDKTRELVWIKYFEHLGLVNTAGLGMTQEAKRDRGRLRSAQANARRVEIEAEHSVYAMYVLKPCTSRNESRESDTVSPDDQQGYSQPLGCVLSSPMATRASLWSARFYLYENTKVKLRSAEACSRSTSVC
jgi:hypothetical protein